MLSLARSQWDAAVVVGTAIELPTVTRLVARVTGEPRIEAVELAGIATVAAQPPGDGPWPTILFLNGSTEDGCADPRATRLLTGLARAGYLALAPELPGVREGVLSIATLEAALAVTREAVGHPRVRGGRVTLLGVSAGASLALLVAAADGVAARVSLVVAIAPFADLRAIARFATTGVYPEEGGLVHYRVEPRLLDVLTQSLAGAHPNGDRRALAALVENRDPTRFESLYSALPQEVRSTVLRLSPLSVAHTLRAPVELICAPIDGYFPLGESRALAQAISGARLTITSTLDHVAPRPSLAELRALARFNGCVVRALAAAR